MKWVAAAVLLVLVLLAATLWAPRESIAPPPPPDESSPPPAGAEPDLAGDPTPTPEYAAEDAVESTGLVLSLTTCEPVAGADVRVGGEHAGPWGATTDAAGRWRLPVPPFVTLRVDAAAPGWFDGFAEFGAPAGAGPFTAPTIYLRPVAGSVAGRVVDSRGRPVAGAAVEVKPRAHVVGEARTDREGRFGPIPAPRGRMWVTAVSPRHVSASKSVFVPPARPPRTVEVELALPEPEWATGIFVDETGAPIPGVELWIDRRLRGTTDEGGRFRLALAPGTREKVDVARPGYDAEERDVEVRAGEDHRFVLERATRVTGRILYADGRPGAGLRIQFCHSLGGYVEYAYADDVGRFNLDPVRPGRQNLDVCAGAMLLFETSLDVPDLAPMDGVVLRLPELIHFEVLVRDALTKRPIAGAEVRSLRGPWNRHPPRTGADGTVRLVHGDAAVSIRASRAGYRTATTRHGPDSPEERVVLDLWPLARVRLRVVDEAGRRLLGVAVSWSDSGTAWLDVRKLSTCDAEGRVELFVPPNRPVTLTLFRPPDWRATVTARGAPGETVDLGDVPLRAEDRTVIVTAVDENGEPIPDAWVEGRDERRWSVFYPDEEGRIRIPTGLLHVAELSAPGRESVPLGRDRGAGPRTVTLGDSAPIRGRVVGPSGKPVAQVRLSVGNRRVHSDGQGRFEIAGYPSGTAVELTVTGPPPWEWDYLTVYGVAGGEEVRVPWPGVGRLRFRVETPPGREEAQNWFLSVHRPGAPEPIEPWDWRPEEGPSRAAEVPAGRMDVVFGVEGGTTRIWSDATVPPGGETVLVYDYPSPGRITGRVVGPGGRPVRRADLDSVITGDTVAYLGDEGLIVPRLSAPAGTTALVVRTPGDAAPLLTEPLDLSAAPDVYLTLPRACTVRGRLRDADGKPLAGEVRVRHESGWLVGRAISGADGAFKLNRIPPGRFDLEARMWGRLPAHVPIRVDPGRETEVRVTIR